MLDHSDESEAEGSNGVDFAFHRYLHLNVAYVEFKFCAAP